MFKRRFIYQRPDDDTTGGGGTADITKTDTTGTTGATDTTKSTDTTQTTQTTQTNEVDWRKSYAGDDAKKLARLERYASPNAAIDALFSVQNRISAGELRSSLPKDATPEQVTAWRNENGIPDAADKYDLGDFKIPDEDKESIGSFLKDMHGANLNNAQAKQAVEWHYKRQEELTELRAAEDLRIAEASQEHLRAEWGTDYKKNMNMISAILDLAPESIRNDFKTGRLGDGTPIMGSADALQWLAGMARTINPVSTVVPGVNGANIGTAIDTEIKQIETLMRTDRKAYDADPKNSTRLMELYDARDRHKT